MQGMLTAAAPANVQACIVDTLTGPTLLIKHIIRHQHVSMYTDQHKGNHADPHRLYGGLTCLTWAHVSHHNVDPDRALLACIRAVLPRRTVVRVGDAVAQA